LGLTVAIELCRASIKATDSASATRLSNTAKLPPDITDAGRPAFRAFTESDGLPQRSVTSITVDQKNYVWVGTQDGIAYYNGRVWTVVHMPNRTDSRTVRAILATDDGAIWVGTDGAGLFRLKDAEWTVFDSDSGLPSNRVLSLCATASELSKAMWVGTDRGLARFQDGEWTRFDSASGLPADNVSAIIEIGSPEREPSLLIGTGRGIARYENGEMKAVTDIDLPESTVYSMLQDRSGAVWIGLRGGLIRLRDNSWTHFDSSTGLPHNEVFALAETVLPDGRSMIWAGTNGGGLARFQNERWTTFDTRRGLTAEVVMSLLAVPASGGSDQLWVGTNGGGLVRFQPNSWVSFDSASGLPNDVVTSFLETSSPDGQRAIWIGTYGGGIARWQDGRWNVFNTTSGLPDNAVWLLREIVSSDGSRAIWAGTDSGVARYHNGRWMPFNTQSEALRFAVYTIAATSALDGSPSVCVGADRGLVCYKEGEWVDIDQSDGFPGGRVNVLLETTEADGSISLWAATEHRGLARLNGGRWQVYNTDTGFPYHSVSSLVETSSADGTHALWAGTDGGGLARLRNGQWRVFNIESGLPSNLVTYLFKNDLPEGGQELWIGTMGGIVSIDPDAENPSFIVLSDATAPALPNNTIYRIESDSQDRIYLFTNKGIARLTRLAPFPQKVTDYEVYTFTTEDGLPQNECVEGASMVDSQGRVWAGTVEGAAMFDPAVESEDRQPKPLYIERTLVGNRLQDLGQNSSLAYDENHLVFEFALLSYKRESGTRFRTQMVGLENNPSEWTSDYKREFSYLPDGDYVLKVWGRDYAGNISGPLEVAFEVRPAPWRTWWAYTLYALATGLIFSSIAFAIYRYRVARLIEIERVRTRIATDLHDDIGSSLSQIAILSEVVMQNTQEGNPEASEPLTKIAATSREMVDSMSDIVWAINPNRDNLRDLVHRMRRFASDILGAKNIDFRFLAPAAEENIKLGADLRRQVFLIFKESVNNCAKHSRCSEADIKFDVEDGSLVLHVSDNGRGFDIDKESDGHGLMSMKQRAESLGGSFEIKSRKGKGTAVLLRVPVEKSRKLRFRK